MSCTNSGEALDLAYVDGEVQPGGNTVGVQFTALPGDQVACEWYLSHAGDDGDTGNDIGNDQPTGGAVTPLPTTGTGRAVWGDGAAAMVAGAALLALIGGVVALVDTHRNDALGR